MSLLSVTVKKARYAGIQAQQYNSYVTLKLQNVKSTTVTVKGPNPYWEQDFLFETNDVNTGLLIEVWCKGMIWDRALGYNYIPLREIQYSNEEGSGQWVSLDAELVMRDGEVVGTKNPTGDSLLVDCRFELPFGRYDPPSGWKTLLAPETERRTGPRSVGDEDNTDWLPLGPKNRTDDWSAGDAENTAGDALQRKLERLNSTIMGHDEQSRRQHQFHGHSGYSEDSDYTSDLNYPIGQHPNSSASQFKSAAQLMCTTPQRSLETSRENSYERDDGPGHLQGSHHQLSPNQGRGYGSQHGYRAYNETDTEPLYYNSRPKDYKEHSRRRKNWDSEDSQGWYGDQYSGYYGRTNDSGNRKREAGERRPSLERQTTLYDDQYYSEQQYYDGSEQQQYQIYNGQNYSEYYNQGYDYQKSYGEEEEDRQWDSGGYYFFSDNYADNYQNHINKKHSSKKLPSTTYSNASQDDAYYTPQSMSYEDDTVDNSRPISAAAERRKLLKQQRQSSENYGSHNTWQSTDKANNWQSSEEYNYYEDYSLANCSVAPPPQPHKKRTLPQIRAPSRNKSSAASLPPTPVRQLPNHITAANKQRTSAPVSRTASTEHYEQNDMYINETYNENYNYAYVSNDNLQNDKFNNYQPEIRTNVKDEVYQNYQNTEEFVSEYDNRIDNYQEVIGPYQNSTDYYQNSLDNYKNQTSDEYYYSEDYNQSSTASYYANDNEKIAPPKKFLARRSNSPFLQQNTDSLESRDDELRDESFETAVDSICSSIPTQKPGTEYHSIEQYQSLDEYKPEPATKAAEQQQQQSQQQQSQQQQQHQTTSVLGGFLGQVMSKTQPSQTAQPQQQQQSDRPRDQTNILTNQALAAMNVTKGFFSSITNAVNNTVQNINKQQKTQATQPQQQEVQRIQITKRGSLKQQESLEKLSIRNRQNSFDRQTQDYMIPKEPEYFEEREEDDYYNKNYEKENDNYYSYEDKDYYENEEQQYSEEKTVEMKNELNQQQEPGRRANHLRHQDTIEAETKTNKRNYLRQQDSLDSCAEEIMMHNAAINHVADASGLDRYEADESRTDEPTADHNNQMRKHSIPHDNSLIEPYHPPAGQEIAKGYSPSPPVIQKQQSVDLDGVDEAMPQPVAPAPEEKQKSVSFEEEEIQPTVEVMMPERRIMTAKERWHRAYNIVMQQLNCAYPQSWLGGTGTKLCSDAGQRITASPSSLGKNLTNDISIPAGKWIIPAENGLQIDETCRLPVSGVYTLMRTSDLKTSASSTSSQVHALHFPNGRELLSEEEIYRAYTEGLSVSDSTCIRRGFLRFNRFSS